MQLEKFIPHIAPLSGSHWDNTITPWVPKFYMKCFGTGLSQWLSQSRISKFWEISCITLWNVLLYFFPFSFFPPSLSKTPISWQLDILDWYLVFLSLFFFYITFSLSFCSIFWDKFKLYLLTLLLNFKNFVTIFLIFSGCYFLFIPFLLK